MSTNWEAIQGLPQSALLNVVVTGDKWTAAPTSDSGTQLPPLRLCSNNLKSHWLLNVFLIIRVKFGMRRLCASLTRGKSSICIRPPPHKQCEL